MDGAVTELIDGGAFFAGKGRNLTFLWQKRGRFFKADMPFFGGGGDRNLTYNSNSGLLDS